MRVQILALALAAALLMAQPAQAQISDDVIKIGVLTDLSGVNSDLAGKGSIIGAELAVAEFGGSIAGKRIEIVWADQQNKPDIGASIARRWIEAEKVDALADINQSSVALAVQNVLRDNKKIGIFTSPAVDALTQEQCSPYSVQWVYDSYSLTAGTSRAIVAQGGDSWYFITSDTPFGRALESSASVAIEQAGGKVLGSVKHPMNTGDFLPFLLQAQASGAKIVAIASAGTDFQNTLKQAAEFGISDGNQKLAALLVYITDIHSLGLEVTQKLLLTTGFYWDKNDETRAWSAKFYGRAGKMPSMIHAGTYSGVRHYLNAIKATGTDNADKVIAWMKANPVNDVFAKNGVVRADGRFVYDMSLVQVKQPNQSKKPWDYYDILRTLPGEQAFRPLSESRCPLITANTSP